MTAAAAIRTGAVGGSPEVYEKINPATGRGTVAIFASAAGSYCYVTRHTAAPGHCWSSENVQIRFDDKRQAVIETQFDSHGARLTFFR